MSSPDAPSLSPETPEQAPALGQSVGRGVAWMLVCVGWSRVLSFLAQWALGLLLTQTQYGIYGVAISLSLFVQVFKDGGGRQLLIQRGAKEYPTLAGSVFWFALLFNIATGLLLAISGPIVSHIYGVPQYTPILVVLGISMPLATPATVLGAKMWIDLKVVPFTLIQMGSALVRYGGMVLLAWLGFGPMSWIWPLIAVALFEGIVSLIVTRDFSWLRRPDFSVWGSLLRTGKWVMLLALALATFNQGPYPIIGKIAGEDAAGVIYFASQIVIQVEVLVAFNLNQVLFPALVRLNAEPHRQRAALLRSLRTLTLIAAPAGLGVALIIDPVEHLLWGAKWESAILPVQILAVFMSARMLYAVPDAILQARGRFKRLSLMVLMLGLGAMAAAAGGAYFGHGDPVIISIWLGLYLSIGCVVFTMASLHLIGLSPGSVLRAVAPAWAVAAAAAAITWLADYTSLHNLHAIPRIVAIGLVYAVLMGPAARLLLARHVEEAMAVMPGRIRTLAMRLIRLRPAGAED